jgi:hypothetical protein
MMRHRRRHRIADRWVSLLEAEYCPRVDQTLAFIPGNMVILADVGDAQPT